MLGVGVMWCMGDTKSSHAGSLIFVLTSPPFSNHYLRHSVYKSSAVYLSVQG